MNTPPMTAEDLAAEEVAENLEHRKRIQALNAVWARRCEGMGYKPGSATRAKAALEFYLGAAVAFEHAGTPLNPMLPMLLSVGRDPIELFGLPDEEKPNAGT